MELTTKLVYHALKIVHSLLKKMSLKADEKALNVSRKIQMFIMSTKNIHSYKSSN